jgi:hypothetical protein
VEDYAKRNRLYHRSSGRSYTMIERDGQWFQQRHQIGFEGKTTNAVETRIDYVIGSGNHARSYLHRTDSGRLIEMPVSWYSENGGYWAMSPGYDRQDQQDLRRAIAFSCLFCHNAYPGSPVAEEGVFPAELPEGIDCQRCHGPGRAHVEAAGRRLWWKPFAARSSTPRVCRANGSSMCACSATWKPRAVPCPM